MTSTSGRVLLITALLLSAIAGAPLAAHADGWAPGPGAVGDSTYQGFIDQPAGGATIPTGNFSVSGWFFDTTAEGWAGADDVEAWVGTMDGGGHLLAKLSFAQNRPDVAAAVGNPSAAPSGFGGVIPPNSLGAGPQTLTVYAHTPAKGWWFQQVQVNVSGAPAPAAAPAPGASGSGLPVVAIERPKDGEQVLTKTDYDIIGWALDPSAKPGQGVANSGVDRVSLWIGPRDQAGSVSLGDANLGYADTTPVGQFGGQFDTSGWRLTFHPTAFHANTYLLYAYAHSAVTGREDSVVRYFAIKEQ